MLQKFILILVLVLCLKNTGYGQEVIVIDTFSRMITGKYFSMYLPKEEVELAQVLNAKFQSTKQRVPNLGIQKNSVWLKFSFINNSIAPFLTLSIRSNTLSEVILYYQKSPGADFDSLEISNLKPLKDRVYKGSDFIFRIDKTSGIPLHYYLRIKSRQPIVLPIYLNLPTDQLAQTVVKNWMNGIFFGMFFIMAIYNLFLFFSIREQSYIYYVAFILTFGLTQLCLKGIAFQYFWPESPFLEANSMVFLASLGGIFALLFTKVFLNIKKISNRWNAFILLLIIPFILSILFLSLGYFEYAFAIMRISTGISTVAILIIAIIVVLKKKNSYAIFFLFSSSFLVIGSIIFILKDFNILPFNFFTDYSVQIFSSIQMTLLSFALANRINILKKQKERSRLKALKLAQENERFVKQQNIVLEQRVVERTFELNQSLEHLKQTQTKLVSAEKMSSLGQLTAGIAHEINNPINFVAANVKPLKRDIFQVFDMMTVVEGIYGQDIPLAEKQKAFALYKEKMDFDFLKKEIVQLLNGINEGASRTANIVKGLRDFSRHDDDEEEFKLSDINAGITSTLTISNNLLDGIEVKREFGDIPYVECHPGSLNQVFLNIITNAIFAIREKFGTEEGGVISINTYSKDEFVFIAIKDNGIGMSDEIKSKLFDPFFTTKPIGVGTGLGMSIVFSLIKQHQGNLIVNSELNIGTELIIRLFITSSKIKKISI